MSPTPYRSSYLAGKKAVTYGSSIVVGRKLGRHLPRIASGDGNEHDETSHQIEDSDAREEEERRLQDRRERRQKWNLEHGRGAPELKVSPTRETRPETELVVPGITGADDVQGMRGRIRLAKTSTPTSEGFAKPLPSAKLGSGLWADVQRHLLQAYEYLCHVGEAQQWIEGCLMEELGFGVVEMEDGLRNGVVLAKLVRSFEGDAAVRRIYEVTFSRSIYIH
jgi:Ras GTPase-activating-like protein IQGAP2/3